jgi:exosortase
VFPLSLLLFTFPIPDLLYYRITQPLQLIASRIAAGCLELSGFSVLRDGNIIQLSHMTLSVAEACSGLRSLLTLFFFCIVYSRFFETVRWIRLTVVFMALPAAILVNALRIAGTGILGRYELAWTVGTNHLALGWVAFTAGILLVMAAHRAIVKLHGRHAGGQSA